MNGVAGTILKRVELSTNRRVHLDGQLLLKNIRTLRQVSAYIERDYDLAYNLEFVHLTKGGKNEVFARPTATVKVLWSIKEFRPDVFCYAMASDWSWRGRNRTHKSVR